MGKNSNKQEKLGHDRIQSELFKYLWNTYPETRRTMWHTANEFIGTAREHSMRKSIGVVSGVTDLVWYWKGVLHCFDIKVGSDKLSDAQKSFIEAIIAQGGKFYEVRNLEDGKGIIDGVMSNKKEEQ